MAIAALDALIDDAVAGGAAPCLVAMVADRAGTLYSGAAGGATDVGPDTIFWLASLSKAITAVAAMQLVEAGRLDLATPAETLFPQLRDPDVLTGFDAEGRPRLRPARRPITLRHLLTHGSGLGYEAMNADLARARGDDRPREATTIASLSGPLLFDPGEGWAYGTGIDWIGLAVEAVTGGTLGAYLAGHVLGPLEMIDTGFDLTPDRAARLAPLFRRDAHDGFTAIPSPAAIGAWEFQSGGAALCGTVGDYMRLLRMLLSGGTLDGTRILGGPSCTALLTNQIGPIRAGATGSVFPTAALPCDLLPDAHTGWSLAGLTNPQDIPGRRRAGSMGWAGLANSYYWVDPAAGLCALITSQFLPFADPAMLDLLDRFERETYAAFA